MLRTYSNTNSYIKHVIERLGIAMCLKIGAGGLSSTMENCHSFLNQFESVEDDDDESVDITSTSSCPPGPILTPFPPPPC